MSVKDLIDDAKKVIAIEDNSAKHIKYHKKHRHRS